MAVSTLGMGAVRMGDTDAALTLRAASDDLLTALIVSCDPSFSFDAPEL